MRNAEYENERKKELNTLWKRPIYITFNYSKVAGKYRKLKSYSRYDINFAIAVGKHVQILKKWYWWHWILLVPRNSTKLAII